MQIQYCGGSGGDCNSSGEISSDGDEDDVGAKQILHRRGLSVVEEDSDSSYIFDPNRLLVLRRAAEVQRAEQVSQWKQRQQWKISTTTPTVPQLDLFETTDHWTRLDSFLDRTFWPRVDNREELKPHFVVTKSTTENELHNIECVPELETTVDSDDGGVIMYSSISSLCDEGNMEAMQSMSSNDDPIGPSDSSPAIDAVCNRNSSSSPLSAVVRSETLEALAVLGQKHWSLPLQRSLLVAQSTDKLDSTIIATHGSSPIALLQSPPTREGVSASSTTKRSRTVVSAWNLLFGKSPPSAAYSSSFANRSESRGAMLTAGECIRTLPLLTLESSALLSSSGSSNDEDPYCDDDDLPRMPPLLDDKEGISAILQWGRLLGWMEQDKRSSWLVIANTDRTTTTTTATKMHVIDFSTRELSSQLDDDDESSWTMQASTIIMMVGSTHQTVCFILAILAAAVGIVVFILQNPGLLGVTVIGHNIIKLTTSISALVSHRYQVEESLSPIVSLAHYTSEGCNWLNHSCMLTITMPVLNYRLSPRDQPNKSNDRIPGMQTDLSLQRNSLDYWKSATSYDRSELDTVAKDRRGVLGFSSSPVAFDQSLLITERESYTHVGDGNAGSELLFIVKDPSSPAATANDVGFPLLAPRDITVQDEKALAIVYVRPLPSAVDARPTTDSVHGIDHTPLESWLVSGNNTANELAYFNVAECIPNVLHALERQEAMAGSLALQPFHQLTEPVNRQQEEARVLIQNTSRLDAPVAAATVVLAAVSDLVKSKQKYHDRFDLFRKFGGGLVPGVRSWLAQKQRSRHRRAGADMLAANVGRSRKSVPYTAAAGGREGFTIIPSFTPTSSETIPQSQSNNNKDRDDEFLGVPLSDIVSQYFRDRKRK